LKDINIIHEDIIAYFVRYHPHETERNGVIMSLRDTNPPRRKKSGYYVCYADTILIGSKEKTTPKDGLFFNDPSCGAGNRTRPGRLCYL